MDSGNSGQGKGKQIAVVLFPGVSALELIGTTSVLNGLGLRTGFRTVTVGPSRDPVAAETPLELIPESTFDQVPHRSVEDHTAADAACAVRASADAAAISGRARRSDLTIVRATSICNRILVEALRR